MKSLKLILAVAGAFAMLASAAQAATIFEGRVVVFSATGCADTKVGQRFTGYYQIANLGGNPNKSVLTLVSDLDADGYLIDGLYDNTFKTAAAADTSSGVVTPFVAQVKVNATPTAANTTTATRFIVMLTHIKNRGNDANGLACTVGIRGAFVIR